MSLLIAGRMDEIKGPFQPELFCDSVHHRRQGVLVVLGKSSVSSYSLASIKQWASLYFVLLDKSDANDFLWSGATSENFKGNVCWLGTLQLKAYISDEIRSY